MSYRERVVKQVEGSARLTRSDEVALELPIGESDWNPDGIESDCVQFAGRRPLSVDEAPLALVWKQSQDIVDPGCSRTGQVE